MSKSRISSFLLPGALVILLISVINSFLKISLGLSLVSLKFLKKPKARKMGKDYEEAFFLVRGILETTIFFNRLCSSFLG